MSTTRTAKKTIVAVTYAEAQTAANTYAAASIKRDKITAELNDKLKAVREKYEPSLTAIEDELSNPVEVLETFAKEQRPSWEAKSIELSNCIIGFRTNPPSVGKKKGITWDAVVGLLKNNKLLKAFVKVKEDVDKAAILKEQSNVKIMKQLQLVGVNIEQEEQFYVDVKKEKVSG